MPPSFVFRKPGPGHHISLPSPRRDCCCARSQGPDSWPIHCWHGDNVTRPRSWPLTGTSAQADTVLRRRPCTRLLQQFLDYFENPLELACGVKVAQLCPTLCDPMDCWNSPGQNNGVVSLSLPQQIFPTQEPNWGHLQGRWILYQLIYQGLSPKVEFKAITESTGVLNQNLGSGTQTTTALRVSVRLLLEDHRRAEVGSCLPSVPSPLKQPWLRSALRSAKRSFPASFAAAT